MASNILSQSGIYRILNIVTGKCYIGSSVKISKRFNHHNMMLCSDKHHSNKLQRSWNKHGKDNFTFNILLICERDNLIMYEQICIDAYDSYKNGYNVAPKAGSTIDIPRTDEWRKNIGLGNKGKIISEDARRKTSLSLTGRKASEESKQKMKESKIGKNSDHSSKSVIRVTDGELFKSGKEACIAHGANFYYEVSRAIKLGIRAFGHYWKFEGDERMLSDFENETTNRQIGKGSHFNGTQSGRGKSARKVIRLSDGLSKFFICGIRFSYFSSSERCLSTNIVSFINSSFSSSFYF